MAAKCSIPVIDLQDFPNQYSKLISTCEEWGCFRLLNYHEVLPLTLMSEMKAVSKSLFDLPMEIKNQNTHVMSASGYIAPTPQNQLYEALGFFDMSSPSDVDTFCSQLDASPHQRETIMRYTGAILELFVRIGEKLAQGLGVKSGNIGFENWISQFRLNKYHFTPESVGSLGVMIHTDVGFLTILQDDEGVGGLEVMNKSGEYITVDPWPGTVLVNLGDMATVWSNGRFRTVKHRVLCKEAKTRFSIASFLSGPREAVEPPPELVDDEHPRVYVSTTYEEYSKLRFSTHLHDGENLALLYTSSSNK